MMYTRSMIDIRPLLPPITTNPRSIINILPSTQDSMFKILEDITAMRFAVIQLQFTPAGEQKSDKYTEYLQYPNITVGTVAKTIVSASDSNDTKMFKIEQWVQDNIEYVSDIVNYGQSELWTYPTVTLKNTSGDCEDGAFLIHSLALHAGVPADKLRTYGGLVWADQWGATVDGHAWTSYKRESDNQWIIADWCYWAKDTPIEERLAMRDEVKYVDDFFYTNITGTTETPYTNRIRYAVMAKGTLVDIKT